MYNVVVKRGKIWIIKPTSFVYGPVWPTFQGHTGECKNILYMYMLYALLFGPAAAGHLWQKIIIKSIHAVAFKLWPYNGHIVLGWSICLLVCDGPHL